MSEATKEIVRGLYADVLNARDPDALERFVEGAELTEFMRQSAAALFTAFPDHHSSIEEMLADGDRVAVRATTTGTHDGEFMGIPPTGRNIAFEYAEHYRIADGRIVGYWCLPDVAGLMRQLTEERVEVAGP